MFLPWNTLLALQARINIEFLHRKNMYLQMCSSSIISKTTGGLYVTLKAIHLLSAQLLSKYSCIHRHYISLWLNQIDEETLQYKNVAV